MRFTALMLAFLGCGLVSVGMHSRWTGRPVPELLARLAIPGRGPESLKKPRKGLQQAKARESQQPSLHVVKGGTGQGTAGDHHVISGQGPTPQVTAPVPLSRPAQPQWDGDSGESAGEQGKGPPDATLEAGLPYDPADLKALERLRESARESGSQVAYIGDVADLYAFDPGFFLKETDAEGHSRLRTRDISSIEEIRTEEGVRQIRVQRRAYPIPRSESVDHDLLSRAIIHAAYDGATLINIATSGIDRASLEPAIQFARSRGAVVVSVAPTANVR